MSELVAAHVALLARLHLLAGGALVLLALWAAVQPRGPGWRHRAETWALALVAGASVTLAGASGWWVDMPTRYMVPGVAAAALLLALFGRTIAPGRLAALALAGFHLALGAAAIRNETPLPPWLAAKSLAFGAVLLLALHGPEAGGRPRRILILLLLLLAAAAGLHRDLPIG